MLKLNEMFEVRQGAKTNLNTSHVKVKQKMWYFFIFSF